MRPAAAFAFAPALALLVAASARADGLPDRFRQRNLGRLHAERGTRAGFEEAAKIFERLVRAAPGSLADELNLARVLLAAEAQPGRIAPHLAAARRLEKKAPSETTLYLEGLLAKRRGDDAEAAARFAAVVAAQPDLLQPRYQLAFAEERRGRLVEAEAAYAALAARAPTFRAAWYRLAMVRGRLRKPDAMRAALARFRTLKKRSRQPDTVRCTFTRVAWRTPRRREAEPPAPKMAWEDRTDAIFGERLPGEVRDVAPVYPAAGRARWLAVVGRAGLRLVSVAKGEAPPKVPPPPGAAHALHTVLALDLDNDRRQDVMVAGAAGISVYFGAPGGAFEAGALLAKIPNAVPGSLRPVDLDHDGDLDLLVVAQGGDSGAGRVPSAGGAAARLVALQNLGDRTVRPFSPDPFSGLVLPPGTRSFDIHDLDRGNDIDLVVPGGGAAATALLNRRDGIFSPAALPGLGGYARLLAEDLTGDGVPDVVALGGKPGLAWAAGKADLAPGAAGVGEAARVATEQALSAALVDADLDGDLDLVLGTASGLRFVRNQAGERLYPEGRVALAGGVGATGLGLADLEGDPASELLVLTTKKKLRVLAARPAPRYAAWRLRPTGRRDSRDAIGTVVEQLCGRLFQSRMVKRAGGVAFGLGAPDRSGLDGVRLRWPLGIRQSVPRDRLKLGAGGVAPVAEKAGVVASCPFLYARGPGGWRFVTDVVGIAPLAEWMPPGAEPALDPEEFVRLPPDALSVEDGRVRIAITEELRETTYLDRVELVAADHPAWAVVYADESTRQGAYDPLRVFVIARRDLRAPAACTRPGGGDARSLVAWRDRRYVHPYRPGPPQLFGWSPPHALDLVTASPARLLLLQGRIAWYTSNVPFALAQRGAGFEPLALLRVTGAGAMPLVADLGFPAGMDRTMVVELPGGVLPTGARLRLTGQHWFLWDRIAFAQGAAAVTLPDEDGAVPLPGGGALWVRTLAPRRAVLRFHGFGEVLGDLGRHEQRYRYDGARPDDTYPPARGLATRYGDVTSLVELADDRVLVLVAGDGVEIDLDAPAPPELGQARTFFLRITGWAKEGSFHNRTGQTVEPLPFRGMPSYPPPPGAGRTDPAYRRYLRAYQTRRVAPGW